MAFFKCIALFLFAASSAKSNPCLGEFQQCPITKDCVLDPILCGRCSPGQYLCPIDQQTCVVTADDYTKCPLLKGTHLDWTLPIETRLDYLTNHTNISEQISQMTNEAPSILRLAIPSYNWDNDDEHGVLQNHATAFPNGCGLGASWSKDTILAVGTAIGREARAIHNGFVHEGNRGRNVNGVGITIYAPNMNLVRDPRWGRAQEVFSEDPNLTSQLTYNFVVGAQFGGDTASSDYLLTAACCKHFFAYDLESEPTLRFLFSANLDARNTWETYMVPFKTCIVEARAAHVMCSYNAVNGVPSCANARLLNGVLREKWKWPGFVVTDYGAWLMVHYTHQFCPNLTCAATVGLKAGVDQEGGSKSVIARLPEALAAKDVTADDIATAFRRLFRVRFRLGMFDPPTLVPWNRLVDDSSNVESAAHIQLARRAAQEAMTLYKNVGGILPLDPSSIRKIAVIGPSALQTELLLGNYAKVPDAGIVSIWTGIQSALGVLPVKANCTLEEDIDYFVPFEAGTKSPNATDCCRQCVASPTCNYFTWHDGMCFKKTSSKGRISALGYVSGKCLSHSERVAFAYGCRDILCPDESGFGEAKDAVQNVDAVVIVLGLNQLLESEGHDRSTIELPGRQAALVSALRKASLNVPLIAVLVHGGTIALGNVASDADAILDAWYPGMQGGHAVADVLFGKYSPGGRASVTSYQSTEDLPSPGTMNLYATNGSAGLTYRYFMGKPLYPFGYGLSFTTFSYSNLTVNSTTPKACDVIGVSVTITNSGDFDGDEVVQVYVQQPDASVPVPNIRLADFERTRLVSSESKLIHLSIKPEFHAIVFNTPDIYQGQVSVERGYLSIFVGGGQPDFFPGHLSISVHVENTQLLETC
eukprot:m.95985 g.95985  ORF g.95985 m.95985 type:complete len:873 (+) comp36884_c0_seq1:58-2676(+)